MHCSLRHLASIVTCLALAPCVSTYASSSGADDGRSGGPTNDAENCTACHDFQQGPGSVQVLDAPVRYRRGFTYDLRVRVFDPDRDGAGFEISVEGRSGHVGTLQLSDLLNTRYTDFSNDYITHTADGADNSVADWNANGSTVDYHVQWQAPTLGGGLLRFYSSGNALNDNGPWSTAHFYAGTAPGQLAVDGDVDGDRDVDLDDYAAMQRCVGQVITTGLEDCAFADGNDDGTITAADLGAFAAAITGPTAAAPAAYYLADSVRGGQLYDKWWKVIGAAEPTGDHPLYPVDGPRSGNTTFRCKECHGWDYKGRDGAYATGSHATGIPGVFGTTLDAQAMFDLLTADPAVTPNGHDFDAYGMSSADIWDVVRMVREKVIDTDPYIIGTALQGNITTGQAQYDLTCARCHGFDGTMLNFGSPADPEYVGTIAAGNPWEFLHKVRFGQPAASMLGFEHLFWTPQFAADVGVYAQTLPTN